MLAALAIYGGLFYIIEHLRTRAGPWQVCFAQPADGMPTLRIDQPRRGITNVQIAFTEVQTHTNFTRNVSFAEARPVPFDVPFGKCVFLDTTSLPGTVVLQMFGHQIQLMPRILTIDRTEHRWRSGESIPLVATNATDGAGLR